jgi:DNA polymerase I-like protein with 3'-5' exonuclease and polymerase domains
MKRVGIEIYERITQAGYVYGVDWCQNAFVHDEYQLSVMSHCINQVRDLVLSSYPAAGEFLQFKCPIEGDVKIGTNWFETH